MVCGFYVILSILKVDTLTNEDFSRVYVKLNFWKLVVSPVPCNSKIVIFTF